MNDNKRGTFVSPKEMVLYGMNQRKKQEQSLLDEASREAEAVLERNAATMSIYEAQSARKMLNKKYMEFSAAVKESLLLESIYSIYNKALDQTNGTDFDRDVKRNYVAQFISENGTEKLLRDFRGSTILLSEMATRIESAHHKIMEGVDKSDESTFAIDSEDRDAFFNDIDDEASEEVANIIRLRVSDAINTFITDNKEDKEKLNDVVAQYEDKASELDPDTDSALEESYTHQLKRKMHNINNRRARGIYETMVWSISEAAMKNEELGKEFCNEGKLNLDKVMHSSYLMYTFLETVGSTKMVNVDPAYIEKVYTELKQI